MFLSTYENKLDKKGRVSVPASFRSYLSNLGYNGVICYPSFNNNCIEAWPQDRIEKISNAIDSLNPFEEKKDYFATSILSESVNLQFDTEGRISITSKLLKHAKIKSNTLFVGQGKTFQIWEPSSYEKFRVMAKKNQIFIEQALNGNVNLTIKGGNMTINFKVPEIKELKPRILVLGVGGAGGNAINEMIDAGVEGVEFVAVNTDAQDLKTSKAKTRIQIGLNVTKGLGAGAKHEIGQAAANESLNDIIDLLKGANMVFITAGMGGGTGTGAAHIIARAAKELNILTVGVVTLPFLYESSSRMRRAQQGLDELRKHVDTIIVIPNQNLFKIANEKTRYTESFQLSNSVLRHGVQSVTDLMVKDGLVNLDFADVETVMSSMGKAMMGTGEAEGEGRATKATEIALNNPLIDDYSLKGAKGLLINITGGDDLTLFEVDEIVNKIRSEVDSEAEIINGSIIDPSLDGKIRVSIVATALDGQQPESKSVINMVHRIQNRNPGYSDFASAQNSVQLNSIKSETIASTSGANALKLDTDELKNTETEMFNSMVDENMALNSMSVDESKIASEEIPLNLDNSTEINQSNLDQEISNGLENFELSDENPQLFNNLNEVENETEAENIKSETEEDELEIPAFLRRQKN